jgi:hypothetical protein
MPGKRSRVSASIRTLRSTEASLAWVRSSVPGCWQTARLKDSSRSPRPTTLQTRPTPHAEQSAAGADGLGVLRPTGGRRRHRRRLRRLGHRPTPRDGEGRDRPDRCVDPDRLSLRSVRRAVGPLDLPRRGRRDQFHRLRRAETVRAGARPAGRAPGPRQPNRARRAVRLVAVPRILHHQQPRHGGRGQPTVVTPSSNTSTPT